MNSMTQFKQQDVQLGTALLVRCDLQLQGSDFLLVTKMNTEQHALNASSPSVHLVLEG